MYLKKEGKNLEKEEIIKINRHFWGGSVRLAIQNKNFVANLFESFSKPAIFEIEKKPAGLLVIENDLAPDLKNLFLGKFDKGFLGQLGRKIVFHLDGDFFDKSIFIFEGLLFDFEIKFYQNQLNNTFYSFNLNNFQKIPADLENLKIISKLTIQKV
jgi:hypothetical protein